MSGNADFSDCLQNLLGLYLYVQSKNSNRRLQNDQEALWYTCTREDKDRIKRFKRIRSAQLILPPILPLLLPIGVPPHSRNQKKFLNAPLPLLLPIGAGDFYAYLRCKHRRWSINGFRVNVKPIILCSRTVRKNSGGVGAAPPH